MAVLIQMHMYLGRGFRRHFNLEAMCGPGGSGVERGRAFHLDKVHHFPRVLEKCLALLAGETFLVLKVLKTGLPLSFSFSRSQKKKKHDQSADEAVTVLLVKVPVLL